MLWFSAFYGTLAHILLDSLYHIDPSMFWGKCHTEQLDGACNLSIEFQVVVTLAIVATPVLWLLRIAARQIYRGFWHFKATHGRKTTTVGEQSNA